MGDFDAALAGGDRRADDAIDAEKVPADRRADDIGNRIHRADFVEVDLANRGAVDLGFGFAEAREDAFGEVFLPLAEAAGVDHVDDVVQMAVGVLGLMLDGDLRGAEAVLLHFGADDLHPGQTRAIARRR